MVLKFYPDEDLVNKEKIWANPQETSIYIIS